jgi:hypothetical protein
MLLQSGGSIVQNLPALAISLLALFISAGKWLYDSRRDKKKFGRDVRIARIDRQLSDLYGPLYTLYETGEVYWFTFVDEHSNDRSVPREFRAFFPEPGRPFPVPSKSQLEEYRLWMSSVFSPINERMEQIMVNQGELIAGRKIPECFQEFCVHVAGNRLAAARWTKAVEPNDLSVEDHKAGFSHPGPRLSEYLRAAYTVLKDTRKKILAEKGEYHITEEQIAKLIDEKYQEAKDEFDEKKAKAIREASEKYLSAATGPQLDTSEISEPDRISRV